MENGSLFDKFKKIISGSVTAKKDIIAVIGSATGISLKDEEITIQALVAWVSVSPSLKNEIFIHKEVILKELALRSNKLKDIRFTG